MAYLNSLEAFLPTDFQELGPTRGAGGTDDVMPVPESRGHLWKASELMAADTHRTSSWKQERTPIKLRFSVI